MRREHRNRSRLEEHHQTKPNEKESATGREVRELLERIEKERMTGSWGKERQPIPDPFKDLDEFLEMDLSTGSNVVVKIKNVDISEGLIKKSIEDNEMMNVRGEGDNMCSKDGKEPNNSKEEDDHNWAELEGASYQCLVCLTSVSWTRQSLTQHLVVHKLDLAQYHGVFGPAIQRQIAKEKVAQGKEVKEKEVSKNVVKEKEISKIEVKKNEAKEAQESMEHNSKVEKLETDPVVEDTNNDTETSKAKSTRSKTVKPKNFECAICKEEFRWTESNITSHLKEKHCLTKEFYVSLYVKGAKTSEEKFNCDKCMFISTRKSALTFHVTKYHTEGEKKDCCKKKFGTKWDLFVHLIENHKDDKDLFAKFDIWQSLEKYYLKSGS